MDAIEAIRKRRSVRRYTDAPVADADVDELVRLGLLAPTGGMSQSWSILVVRDAAKRAALADLIIRGGGRVLRDDAPAARRARPPRSTPSGAASYAQQALGTYPQVPVWLVGLLVPRNLFPADERGSERDADMVSVGFMMENIFVAARAKGLGTVPTVFQWFVEDEFRALLDIPAEVEVPLLTPLGHPEEFPVGLPPALAAIRRPWRTLVHDDAWGNPRA